MKRLGYLSVLVGFGCLLMSCASTPQELEYKMMEKESKFDQRQEKWDIRASSFERRMQKMSDNADARYNASFDRIMTGE
ncbi:MAG: hypothetical protein AAGA96_01765 [Verrucomicrobiota bacterium]